MAFRRSFYQAERAAAAAATATDKRRRRQWMLVSACLLGLWMISSLAWVISGGREGRAGGRAGVGGGVEGMQCNVTQAGGEERSGGGEGGRGRGFSFWGGKAPADVSVFSSQSSFLASCFSHPLIPPLPPSLPPSLSPSALRPLIPPRGEGSGPLVGRAQDSPAGQECARARGNDGPPAHPQD